VAIWYRGAVQNLQALCRATSPLFLACTLAACGGSTTGGAGSGSTSGTVAGVSFSFASGLATSMSTCIADGSEACEVVIELTNHAGYTCATMLAADPTARRASFDDLFLTVASGRAPLTAGTYDVAPPDAGTAFIAGATAGLLATTSMCEREPNRSATGGFVTLRNVNPTRVAGSYSVTFSGEGSFSGAFDVGICPLPWKASTVPNDCP